MKSTSLVSAKDIPKMVAEPDTSGIRPTETISGPTSEPSTAWTVTLNTGVSYIVRLPGANGRISYGRNVRSDTAEVRFYRDATTKVYDAVIPSVVMVVRDTVIIEDLPKPKEIIEEEERIKKKQADREERRAKEALEAVTEAIMSREYAVDGPETVKVEW